MAEVKKLVLGHFSSRYTDKEKFLFEAQTIFDRVVLSSDGKTIEL